MIPRPDRPDPERLIADLGIQPRQRSADAAEALADLADLGERRHVVLGTPRIEPRRLTEAEFQHALDALGELVEQARQERQEDWW